MAKSSGARSTAKSGKISFGKKSKSGKAKKNFGPREEKPKRYRGQGR